MKIGCLAAALLCCATGTAADATLVEVDVLLDSPERWAARLQLSGTGFSATGARLDATRFVVDLSPARWSGEPVRRRGDGGVLELRWANFRNDPATLRVVVEHREGWRCSAEQRGSAVELGCRGASALSNREVVGELRGLELFTPLRGFTSEQILAHSLEYSPRDVVRDGLPHFGALRDDWKGTPRRHQGLDIYADDIEVLAMAAGTVVGAGRGPRSGGWVKLDHGRGVESLYVHVQRPRVRDGEQVKRGQPIAEIRGAVGNAVEAQLHLEIRLDGQAVDPAPIFAAAAPPELRGAWQQAIDHIPQRVGHREQALREQQY